MKPIELFIFISKVSANGVFQWVQTFGGCDGSRDNRVVLDSANNVYVVGGFYGTKSFGTSTKTSAGGVDIFVVKYDKNGNFQWVETAGGLLSDRANSITIDHYNDLYITGEFRDIINFGSDVLNNYGGPNGRDIFVAKMKTNGTWLWADKAGGNGGSDRGNRIIANQQGNIFVTGQFKKSCKFSPTVTLNNTKTVNALAIPRKALVGSTKRPRVYVVKGGKAKLVSFTAGTSDGEFIEVVDGIIATDLVITKGQINIQNNANVITK